MPKTKVPCPDCDGDCFLDNRMDFTHPGDDRCDRCDALGEIEVDMADPETVPAIPAMPLSAVRS